MRLLFLLASLLVAAITVAQTQKASGVADFISVDTPVFVLDHVRVIDGTGTQAKEDQAIAIANGKIRFIGPDESAEIPPGAKRMDCGRQMDAASVNWTLLWRSRPRFSDFLAADPMPRSDLLWKGKCA
jgi:hypothetical protein